MHGTAVCQKGRPMETATPTTSMADRLVKAEVVLLFLERLVRDEYPDEYSTREIAIIWGWATPEELDALSILDELHERASNSA